MEYRLFHYRNTGEHHGCQSFFYGENGLKYLGVVVVIPLHPVKTFSFEKSAIY